MLQSGAAQIPFTGLQAENEGVANWSYYTLQNQQNPGQGVDPVQVGHNITWLEDAVQAATGSRPTINAYYNLASPEDEGINPASTSALTLKQNAGNHQLAGFPNFTAALAAGGFTLADIDVRFGRMTLGADQSPADWSYDANPPRTETRRYRGGNVTFYLNGNALVGGPMPDFEFVVEYHNLVHANGMLDQDDDLISATTAVVRPNDMSQGAPADVQAVAAAFLQDLGAEGGIRLIMDQIQQAEVQSEFQVNRPNALIAIGGFYEAVSGKIELVQPQMQPILNIGDASTPEGDVGNANLAFPVNLNMAAAQAISVDFSVADGSAKAGTDFNTVNGTLNIAAGDTQAVVNVPIIGDTHHEGNEIFTVTLANPQGAQLGQAQAMGTIQNDDGDFISIIGVRANNEGSGAWNEPGDPTHQQPDGGTSYYRMASVEFEGIDPASQGGGRGATPYSGFQNTLQALMNNGRSVADLRLRFGEATLGAHQEGVDWSIAGNVETRLYRGGTFSIFLLGEEMLSGPMPDLTMTLNFNGAGTGDDEFDGVTIPFTLNDTSANSSAAAQQIAAALLQDIGNGQLRSVFAGFEPITQTGLSSGNKSGAFFNSPVGRLELLPGQNPPPAGSQLSIADAVADEGAGNITFDVTLQPAAAAAVSVDFTFMDDSAEEGADFTGVNGTLNFPAGSTTQSLTVPVADDSAVEINEQFFVSLGNANGAGIQNAQAAGVILDNDFPDFPPIDPEFYPTNSPCICTPLAGIYRTNASEIWHMKLLGTAGLLRVAAVAVSTNEASTVEALVYNSAGTLVGSNQVSYTVPELVAAGVQFYTKWVDINISNQLAGDRLRIEVHNLPPTPLSQTHYRLHGAGVRWMSTPSPSFAGFEAEETRWRFLVHSNENLVINYFTNNLPGFAGIDYTLFDPAGNTVLNATNAPIVIPDEIVVSNAVPGLWTLQMRARDHYRISKRSGLDRNIYADWRTGAYADQKVFVKLDGTNAVGTHYDVVLDRIDTWGGLTNFVHYRSQIASNGMANFPNVQQGLYRISVNPLMAGISVPLPQFEIMACDHPLTNVFETFPGGGTNNPPEGPALYAQNGMVLEGTGSTVTLNMDVGLWPASTNAVAVDYVTAPVTATEGVDYVAASGTLNFPAGTTNLTVGITVKPDAVLEPTEFLTLNLSNAVNAAIATPQGLGAIKDDDRPDFPGDNDDPFPYPTNAPCICTPLAGQYVTNSAEVWWIHSTGGPVDMRLIAHSVNNNDPSDIVANVYDSTGALVITTNVAYTAAEAAANPVQWEKSVMVPLGTRTPGEVLRVEITLGPGTPLTQTHYRLTTCGARWMATPSPSFAGFEAAPAQWRLRVHPSDTNLVVNLFTNDLPGFAPFEYYLIDPTGAVVMSSTNQPIVTGPEIAVAAPMAGLWTLIIDSQDHYRISKESGLDRALYADWRTGSSGEIIGQINLNGSPAFGTSFDVELYQHVMTSAGPTNILWDRKLVTNAFFGFHDLFGGTWVVRPLSMSTNVPDPTPQTNLLFCDMALTNVFNTTGQGGGGNTNEPPQGPLLWAHRGMVREGTGSSVTLLMDVTMSSPATNTVTVDYFTTPWTATEGVDYHAANGTLTFPAGSTVQTVAITVIEDAVFEPTELLYLNLTNAANAGIAKPQATGVIKDDDHPDFPDDTPLPSPLPCICTPVVGNYNSNAIHSWSTKAFGGPLDLEFRLVSVNTNEPATQVIRVYDAGGSMIASNSVTMSLAEVQSAPNYEESVMVALGTRPAGEILRLEVELLTGPFNAHYSLKLCGSRWLGTASPSFSAFEEEPTRYRFVVRTAEDLHLDIFTNGITPDVASHVPLRLFDPSGAQVALPAYPTTVVAGNEINITNATPGIWTLEANLTNRLIGHYRLNKPTGINRGIFFDWASGGCRVMIDKITVNSNPPPAGMLFSINMYRQRDVAGTPILEPFVSTVLSNHVNVIDPYEMLPGVYVTELVPPGTNLGPAQWATNFVACMGVTTNCFDFVGTIDGGGGTNTNQPPQGPAFYVFDGMIREGNATNRTMMIPVRLWPVATNEVTVDYWTGDGSATSPADYLPASGTLTVPAGITSMFIPVTVIGDSLIETTEVFDLTLSNAVGAAIAQAHGHGVIKDDDYPDFPGDNDDPLPFPSPAPCICTPLAGQYETNNAQVWMVRSLGGSMTMRLYGVTVNTNDGSTIVAEVYDSTGALIATPSVSYTSAEAAAGGLRWEKWVDVPLGTHPAGAVLRVEVGLGAGTPLPQTHYRLRFCGARWIGTHSPSFPGFEDDSALWRLRVLPGDTHLNIDFFTTNTPTAATAMEYELYNPNGVVVSSSGSLPINPGDELSVTNPIAGLWALRCKTNHDHYRLAKSGGADNTLYLGWRGASWGNLSGLIKLNGTKAVGTTYDVTANYQYRVNGVLTNFPIASQLTSNAMFHFENIQQGIYVVTATPMTAGVSTPAPQSNVVACGLDPQLMFQTFSSAGGAPTIQPVQLVVFEGDTSNTVHLELRLTSVTNVEVSVMYATATGTATAGIDFAQASGTAVIPAGSNSVTIPVHILGDTFFELHEIILVNLNNPVGAALGSSQATIQVRNDDRPVSARFHRIRRLQAGGPFKLEFDIGDIQAVYEVQASDNLMQWQTIGQVTGTAGNFEYTDDGSTNRTRRYYRAIALEPDTSGNTP